MRQLTLVLLLCLGTSLFAQEDIPIVTARSHVRHVSHGPKVIKRVPPVYSEEARTKNLEGTVMVRVVIDKKGEAKSVTAISGDPILAKAAVAAVKQWRWEPYKIADQVYEIETDLAIGFHRGPAPENPHAGMDSPAH